MSANAPVDILMYHSISDCGGPTSIRPEVFAIQMAALAESRRPVVGIDRLTSGSWPDGAVILTFDDAFEDFATAAWPVLGRHGFPAVVYVPTRAVGKVEDWRGALDPPRRVMDWATIRRLAAEGVTFGSHTVAHSDLTGLDATARDEQLVRSQEILEHELGQPVRHFAPPYGRTTSSVRAAISRHYATSVGTELGQARASSDKYDLPRLEMFYFTSERIWTRHLEGRGGPYLVLRQGLRRIRNIVSHPATRA